jgi:methylated-DNA-protein-cysteine methyltransferase related protein
MPRAATDPRPRPPAASRPGATPEGRQARHAVFARRVLSVVQRIPVGRVATYGDVAALAGAPRAARAVGNVLRRARVPGVPYHRVIGAGGRLGGYGGQLHLKRALLAAEGLSVTAVRVRDFDAVRWRGRARR